MVITDAGASEWAPALVYVCAFLPTAGLCLFDQGLQDPPLGEQPNALIPCVRFTGDGTAMFLDGDGVVDALYADCEPEAQHRALARLDCQPTASFRQTPRLLAWQWKPTTYIVCTEDRTIPSWLQRRMAANAGRVVELKASHSPFCLFPMNWPSYSRPVPCRQRDRFDPGPAPAGATSLSCAHEPLTAWCSIGTPWVEASPRPNCRSSPDLGAPNARTECHQTRATRLDRSARIAPSPSACPSCGVALTFDAIAREDLFCLAPARKSAKIGR